MAWVKSFTREIPVYFYGLIFRGYFAEMKRAFGWSFSRALLVSERGVSTSYRDSADVESFKRFFGAKLGDESFWREACGEVTRRAGELRAAVVEANALNSAGLTDGELSERIRLLGETYSRFWAVYPLPVYAESWLGAEAKRFYSLFEETRAATGGVYEQAQDALAKLVSEAAARKKIPSVFALSALPNEDFASLDSSELRARFDYCVYEASEEENVVLTGARAREFTRGILVGVEEQRVLKGKPVFSRGVVRGRVARIFTLADLKAAPAGSVIVSPMTKIDFVPFLRKAKAIITDEGGITSHAAIIARELGIPCVVGVKRATDVLREGSEVEIDCDSGVVKALK